MQVITRFTYDILKHVFLVAYLKKRIRITQEIIVRVSYEKLCEYIFIGRPE